MEFLSGYAAAKAPYLTYEVDGSPHSRSQPARSNSTSGSTTKKRSRIPGHARTNSASTNSSGGRTDPQQALPPTSSSSGAGWLQQSPGGADAASGAGIDPTGAAAAARSSLGDGADPTAEQQQQQPQHRTRRRNSTRDRMPSSLRYFQDKQLPATPRLNTQHLAGHASEPASARTPASATATTASTFGNPGAVVAAVAFPDRRNPHHSTMFAYADGSSSKLSGGGGTRAESISSVSGATTTSNRTMQSSEHTSDSGYQHRPFIVRNGRTYLADPTLAYPLPVDLQELHRQSLRTILLLQLFGRPICTPTYADKPPPRIIEIGCATGFWSMMCYEHYKERGQHKDISFTGLDIVSLPPNSSPNSSGSSSSSSADTSADNRPAKGMNWRFVQHDMRKLPFPFPDSSFDLIMAKDVNLAISIPMQQGIVEEYIRILAPGGTLEIWDCDQMLRMLRPHVPDCPTTSGPVITDNDGNTPTPTQDQPGPDEGDETELGGAYVMTPKTPLSTPLNNFLVEYNSWVARALEARALCTMPCTLIGPLLIQESEVLTGVGSRRLAVPLSEIRWEKEGVGGVVTKDGKSYIETGGIRRAGSSVVGGGGGSVAGESSSSGRGLEPAAAALRRTALLTIVQQIQSMEPMLREASGKSQDEWDAWLGKMMNDLVRENGTSWGECLEVGAWWATKR